MGYFDVANSPLLYLLVAAGILYIVGLSAVFLRKSWRRCLKLGISREKLRSVARSSAVFTVVPSISIVIGLFTLSTVLGVPWPWYRLSVVGSVSYELLAAAGILYIVGLSAVFLHKAWKRCWSWAFPGKIFGLWPAAQPFSPSSPPSPS